MINIIVAFAAKNFAIGNKGGLPWGHLPKDMARFRELTTGSVVVMGRKTWDSLPRKPLDGRINVVVTSNPGKYGLVEGAVFLTIEELDSFLLSYSHKNIFIIGGNGLYGKYLGVAENIYATVIENECEGDTFFPIENFHRYIIDEYGEQESHNIIKYRFIKYTLNSKSHDEFGYLINMDHIIHQGQPVREDRTKVGTYSIFGPQLRFDISKSFPLLTTKFVGFKTIIKELLFFLRGDTNTKHLEEQGVNIWKANTSREFLDMRGLTEYAEGDMGPMYGFNWRYYGADYKGCDANYEGEGYDQLNELINGIKNDPYSRRHMITTYNPTEVSKSVLAPCHGIIAQFYVHQDSTLSCHVYCRSQDTFLGQPYNIASYAALTYIIAKKCNLRPNTLILSAGDCHVYSNHVEQVYQQLYRKPLPFPVLEVKDKSWEEYHVDDFKLIGYLHHPTIKAEMAT